MVLADGKSIIYGGVRNPRSGGRGKPEAALGCYISLMGAIMSSTKTINFYLLIIALLVYLIFSSTQSASPDPYKGSLYEDLSRSYGFCKGQRFSVERIQKEFPDLAPQVIKAQMEFDLVFKFSYENTEKTLKETLRNYWFREEKDG